MPRGKRGKLTVWHPERSATAPGALMPNRLASSTSPYMRQYADDPVDWREWNEDAFTEARGRDVPIFRSVGSTACHWWHVMAPGV